MFVVVLVNIRVVTAIITVVVMIMVKLWSLLWLLCFVFNSKCDDDTDDGKKKRTNHVNADKRDNAANEPEAPSACSAKLTSH